MVFRSLLSVAAAVALSVGLTVAGGLSVSEQAEAGNAKSNRAAAIRSYRSGPQVRGFVRRRGGYSYARQDTINTYNDSRTFYGSTNTFRDRGLDRQSNSGPFDHGWFFDSGNGLAGGQSPYMN